MKMQNTNKLVFCDNVHVKIISMKSDDDAIAVSKLAYCEAQKIAIENYGAYNWTIEKDNKGKPYYKYSKDYFFSVSHTGKTVAVAVCKGISVGVDIEKIQKISDRIVNKYYTELEKKQIDLSMINKQIEETRIWTLKEAHCKCIGTGLDKDSLRWCSVKETRMVLESQVIDDCCGQAFL